MRKMKLTFTAEFQIPDNVKIHDGGIFECEEVMFELVLSFNCVEIDTNNPEERKPLFPREVVHKWGPKSLAYPIVLPDTPDLSDIESVTFTKYYDVTNKLRVKAEIKIKNSSVRKDSVIGVDARIFNIGG